MGYLTHKVVVLNSRKNGDAGRRVKGFHGALTAEFVGVHTEKANCLLTLNAKWV
jgi:hypothetical protein